MTMRDMMREVRMSLHTLTNHQYQCTGTGPVPVPVPVPVSGPRYRFDPEAELDAPRVDSQRPHAAGWSMERTEFDVALPLAAGGERGTPPRARGSHGSGARGPTVTSSDG